MTSSSGNRIAVGPAGGSLADAIVRRLSDDHLVIALGATERVDALETTSAPPNPERRELGPGVTRRPCDFFSRIATRRALASTDTAIFLVGGLAESSGRYPPDLSQGEAVDLELNRADNVARAVKYHDIPRVVCLRYRQFDAGCPSTAQLREVFGQAHCTVSIISCSIIIDRLSPIIQTLRQTLARFPFLFLPRWHANEVHPLYGGDLSARLASLVTTHRDDTTDLQLVGPDAVSLRHLIEKMRARLDLMCRLVPTPFDLSTSTPRWLASLSDVDRADVRTWLNAFRMGESPDDETASTSDAEQVEAETHLDEALERSLASSPDSEPDRPTSAHDGSTLAPRPRTELTRRPARRPRTARSVQQLPLPAGRSADWAASEYTEWLPGFFRPFLRVDVNDAKTVQFFFLLIPWPLLVLTFDSSASAPNRQLFWISGGLLAKPQEHGRLEFREVLDGNSLLACVHDFNPRLPWLVYRWTQAPVHAWVMRRFAQHLDSDPPALEDTRSRSSEITHDHDHRSSGE